MQTDTWWNLELGQPYKQQDLICQLMTKQQQIPFSNINYYKLNICFDFNMSYSTKYLFWFHNEQECIKCLICFGFETLKYIYSLCIINSKCFISFHCNWFYFSLSNYYQNIKLYNIHNLITKKQIWIHT